MGQNQILYINKNILEICHSVAVCVESYSKAELPNKKLQIIDICFMLNS